MSETLIDKLPFKPARERLLGALDRERKARQKEQKRRKTAEQEVKVLKLKALEAGPQGPEKRGEGRSRQSSHSEVPKGQDVAGSGKSGGIAGLNTV